MAASERDRAADALAAMTGGGEPAAAEGESSEAADTTPDDAVAAPAPTLDVFAPKHRTADLIAQHQLDAYRTAIPILLTLGVIFLIVASLKWISPDGSPFVEWESWVSFVFLLGGLAVLAVAILNMLHVRNQLARIGR
jgi:hypothetical protein